MARLLVLEGLLYEHQGRREKAVKSHIDGIEFGTDVARGGPIIHKRLEVAIEATIAGQLIRYIAHLSAEDTHKQARHMERILARQVPYSEALENERVLCLSGIVEILQRYYNF